tara:strand:- start:772 stop:2877 length:2106 start_codon:yes stop_codon:yes gene_type:complete
MERPHIKKLMDYNLFGAVDMTRGGANNVLIEPPIQHEDQYKWIRDDNRIDSDVLNMLNLENDYTKYVMEDMEVEQKKIYDELLSNIKEDYDSYPLPPSFSGWDSPYYYFTRTQKGKSYATYCRIDQITKEETILVDVNKLAEGKTTFDLSGFRVNDDQTIMSYGVDLKGNEKYTIHMYNIESGEEIEHTIPELVYCAYKWIGNTIFYYKGTEQNRIYQIWKYDMNSKSHDLLYECTDELHSASMSISENRDYLFITSSSVETTDMYYMKMDNLETCSSNSLIHFTEQMKGIKYEVSYFDNQFYIVTNKDDSRNFKIMTCSTDNTNSESWNDWTAYDESKYIEGVEMLTNFMLVEYKENGNTFIKAVHHVSKEEHIIDIDDDIKNMGLIMSVYESDKIIYYHTSLKKPMTYYEYNLNDKSSNIVRIKEVPNYDNTLYTTERIFAKGHDGVSIPISLIYRKDKVEKDGLNPLYLYGYGSYGITVDPNFRGSILPLLNRGFIYAIAHVRGGSFLGYKWFEDGKMLNKLNTFKDFISCAEHLIENNYTIKKQITIEGRSAGGLLVGAALTMRPDLFRTVIAGVPFVDVMNTMCDPSIPLTIPEWEQWGNPNEQLYYDYIKQYSPYDNIKAVEYPNVLALGGLNDPRVGYWEPAKFIAKLREHDTSSNNLLLLKTEMEQGHFGQTDRYQYLRELSFDYAFVLKTYK